MTCNTANPPMIEQQSLQPVDLIQHKDEYPAVLTYEQSHWQDWANSWHLDGQAHGKVEPDAKNSTAMAMTAGPNVQDNGNSVVLWTRQSFTGDIRIEYDFTRRDSASQGVCILYFHAQGDGVGDNQPDILQWSHRRQQALMSHYFKNMNLMHISYSVLGGNGGPDYIRARRYPMKPDGDFGKDTEVPGTYFRQGMFEPGITYHLTTILKGNDLYFRVTGNGQDKLYQWDISMFPQVTQGRIGLRQMPTRQCRYANFKVWTQPTSK
jgi:hypothetical protein